MFITIGVIVLIILHILFMIIAILIILKSYWEARTGIYCDKCKNKRYVKCPLCGDMHIGRRNCVLCKDKQLIHCNKCTPF